MIHIQFTSCCCSVFGYSANFGLPIAGKYSRSCPSKVQVNFPWKLSAVSLYGGEIKNARKTLGRKVSFDFLFSICYTRDKVYCLVGRDIS
jgi:hypothetical protein